MDLVERAGRLKPKLVEFALSPRFDREFSAVIARNFPGGVVTDESAFSMVFAMQVRPLVRTHANTQARRRTATKLHAWQDHMSGLRCPPCALHRILITQ